MDLMKKRGGLGRIWKLVSVLNVWQSGDVGHRLMQSALGLFPPNLVLLGSPWFVCRWWKLRLERVSQRWELHKATAQLWPHRLLHPTQIVSSGINYNAELVVWNQISVILQLRQNDCSCCCFFSELQTTPCQPAATWTWRTGSPTWSRSCSSRRTKSSCWNQLWPTPCVAWATARSTPRGRTREVLVGGLWLPRLQPSRPKVTQVERCWRWRLPLQAADEPSVFLWRWICSTVPGFQIITDMLQRVIDLLTDLTAII